MEKLNERQKKPLFYLMRQVPIFRKDQIDLNKTPVRIAHEKLEDLLNKGF